MMETLAERLKHAMMGPPKVTQAALARACMVSPPSVSDWISGKTKSLDGVNLLRAASFLNVRPRWLAEGRGPMKPDNPYRSAEVLRVAEPAAASSQERQRALALLNAVPDMALEEVVLFLEWIQTRYQGNTSRATKANGL